VANIPLDNRPYFIATGEDAVWVGGYDPKSKIVYRINPHTNQVVATIQLGPKGSNDSQGPIVTGEGAVWILHDKNSLLKGTLLFLSRIGPQTNQVTATIPVDYGFAAWRTRIEVGSGSLWVAKYQKKIFRIDPQSSQVEDTFKESLDPRYWIINMAVTEDTLWILGLNSKDSIMGLGEYDIEKNALRSITVLGSSKFGKGSDELPVGESTLTTADDAVWACLPLGIYVIPKSTKTNQPGVP
jgi:DNA-binding beta-propeller fold protein YncE